MIRSGCVLLLEFSGYMSPEYAIEGRFSEKSDRSEERRVGKECSS